MATNQNPTGSPMIESPSRETVVPASEAAALVGDTPVARYASWADHRSAIRRSAEDAHADALARRERHISA